MDVIADSGIESPAGVNRRSQPVVVTDALLERFWSKVDSSDPDGCWPWKASLRCGYGAIKVDGKMYSSHRLAYVLTNGEPESHLVIGHECDNRVCCNPDHLEAITVRKNNFDLHRVGCLCDRGENARQAVLTTRDVMEILRVYGSGCGFKKTADTLGVSRDLCLAVLRGRTWRHITGGINRMREGRSLLSQFVYTEDISGTSSGCETHAYVCRSCDAKFRTRDGGYPSKCVNCQAASVVWGN